jgi:hypothetical protein
MNAKRRFVESVERELLHEIETLVGRNFVYEDVWCGMVPFDGELSELQTGPPVAFAELTWHEQADVLREFIHWDNYPARNWDDEYVIKDNIAAGKPSEQWLQGTSLHESFRLLGEGKTPPPPKECPEISEQDLRAALAEAGDASGISASESQASADAKAFQDIFRNDEPREAATKTQEWSGWEV